MASPLLALSLAACDTLPSNPFGSPKPYAPAGVPEPEGRYRALGTEPFWDLNIGRNLVFTDRGDNLSVIEPALAPIVAGRPYRGRRLTVTVVASQCSDGMSDRIYPDTVTVTVDGRPYRGCGGPGAAFYPAVERGLPGPALGQINLANSNWRVVAINGQPVPRRGYYLNFMPDRMAGKLGCNALGAGYSVTGDMLRAGAIMITRMACPNGSFEAEGTAIMAQPMTFSGVGNRLTLSNRVGTIELIRAR